MERTVLDSIDFFDASIEALEIGAVANVWGIKPRQVYRYRARPEHCGSVCDDPLKRLRDQLQRLKELNRTDVIEGGLKYLADPVGYIVQEKDVATDRNSAYRELLDVNREIGELSRSIQDIIEENNVSDRFKARVFRQADEAIRQLQELKDAIAKGLK